MPAIQILPKEDATNGWSRILPARTPAAPLDGDVRADWLVVGGGFAGLAAARRLAQNRPNDQVVLLEAHEVGEGASGRNSGFAIDLPHNVGGEFEELSGSQGFMRLSRAAIAYLDECVTTQGIDCGYTHRGKYHASTSEVGREKILEPFARELEALGEPYRWLDRAELQKEIGSPYHHAAIHTPGGRLVNPAGLVQGLAATMPENVTLHEHTPVVEIEQRNGIRAVTPQGTVNANAMVLAVNGYAPQFAAFSRRLLTFAAYGSLTRPLTDAEHQAMGAVEDWGLTPANSFVGVTMRYTPERRILIRHRFRYAPTLRRPDAEYGVVRRDHQRLFLERFPMLPDVRIEHTWRGYVCLSRNHAPGFGKVGPHTYAAVCQNAVGMTKGTIGGVLAADMATGEDNPLIADMEAQGTPTPLPPEPFLSLGIRARFAFDNWLWRRER
jgi:glycine/D-amino acid oxidase-like deaminating enzyme